MDDLKSAQEKVVMARKGGDAEEIASAEALLKSLEASAQAKPSRKAKG